MLGECGFFVKHEWILIPTIKRMNEVDHTKTSAAAVSISDTLFVDFFYYSSEKLHET